MDAVLVEDGVGGSDDLRALVTVRSAGSGGMARDGGGLARDKIGWRRGGPGQIGCLHRSRRRRGRVAGDRDDLAVEPRELPLDELALTEEFLQTVGRGGAERSRAPRAVSNPQKSAELASGAEMFG